MAAAAAAARERRREQLRRWEAAAAAAPPPPPAPPAPRARAVRFERAAEFRAVCAGADLAEARAMVRAGGRALLGGANADGISALHQACIDENMEVVQFLVESGADVNQADNEGWTPLHVAASCGYRHIAQYLLEHGADVAAVTSDGELPLEVAEDEGLEALLRAEVARRGVDVAAAKRAEEERMLRDTRRWLDAGEIRDARHPATGASALHVAAAKGYIEVMRLLLQAGYDPDVRDKDGWTPLHAAAHWGVEEACRLLAEHLCDMAPRNNVGQRPCDLADEETLPLLEELQRRQHHLRSQKEPGAAPAPMAPDPEGTPTPAWGGKHRRSSVCRMSSRAKMSVQDQSKERPGPLPPPGDEDEEGGDGAPPPQDPPVAPPPPSCPPNGPPAGKSKEPRLARVPPSPARRRCAPPAAAPPDGDLPAPPSTAEPRPRRSYQAPARDEESESQRKARSRLMRQSRRSTQGVTLTELKEAEKTIGRGGDGRAPEQRIGEEERRDREEGEQPLESSDPARRSRLPAPPGPPVKKGPEEPRSRPGGRDRRKWRRGSGTEGSESDEPGSGEDAPPHSFPQPPNGLLPPRPPPQPPAFDYRQLYDELWAENERLREQLQETELKLTQIKLELERVTQRQERIAQRPALLELERFERRALERKAAELEEELKALSDLRADNQRLKDENAALIRVISKLSK
ncbi:protein phosphatase 1 regulatory subunit 12C isoform X7 [Calonectris borealis]|uniref:protein phosphatase 1 regulatory subunit 12C isoform X7 n=1 Tax=Calonectris borealis TaxID=1323832 RepID=UPI003F4BB450